MIRWFMAGLLLAGLLLGVACGDDVDGSNGASSGSPTATLQPGDGSAEAKFFAEWVAIHADVQGRIEANSAAYPAAFNGDLKDTKTSFPIYLQLFDEFDQRVGELDVPASVRSAFDETVAADHATSVIDHRRAERLADATTYAEVDDIFGDDPLFTAASERGTEACTAFQQLGKQHDIVFDHRCED